MAEAEDEAKVEGRHEKVDNGGRIYRTRTAVVGRKKRRGEGKRRPAGRSHTLHTHSGGRRHTLARMRASLHSVSKKS